MTPNVLLLTAAIATIGSNSLMLSPLSAAVAADLDGQSAADTMLAAAGFGLGTALSALFLAPMADRIGAGKALQAALAVVAFAFLLSMIAPNLVVLITAQALAGIAAGIAFPSIYALAAIVATKGRESETLGLVLTGWTIALVAGVGLAAIIAEFLHWRAVFGILFVSTGVMAICVSPLRHAQSPRSTTSSPLTAIRVPRIAPLLAICVAFMIAFYGTYTYLGAHMIEVLGQSTLLAGLASVSYGIGFGVAVPLDRLIDHFGDQRASPPAFGLLALTYGGMAIAANNGWALVAVCFFWGVINHLGVNLLLKQLAAIDPSQRGAVMGLYSAITYLGVTLGAVLFRPIFEHWGLAICAALSALCVAFAFLVTLKRPSTA